MVPKRQGAGYLPTKYSASVSPVQTQMGDGPCQCTAHLCVCKHPRGCEGAVHETCSACVHAHLQARMTPPATAAAVARAHCSHTQVQVPPCTHSHGFVHVHASPSSPGTCSHRATHGWSLGSPQSCCHPTTPTDVCVLRRGVTHPAAVGKAPAGQGLPRHSCWVTVRPNDAMSSFAYAKQHHCCRMPREEALPPAPRDPLGCPGMPTHLPCTHPPLCPGLHGFINSNYPHQ